MKKIFLIIFLVAIFSLLIPNQASAGGLVPCGGPPPEVSCEFCHLFVMFDCIIKFIIYRIVPSIAVLMLVIGGIMFFAAMGNPEKLGTAKNLITSVVKGLVIIYAAWLIIGAF